MATSPIPSRLEEIPPGLDDSRIYTTSVDSTKGDAKGFDKEKRAEIIGRVYKRLTEDKVWNKGAFGTGGRKVKSMADRATELGLEMTAQERAFLEKFTEAERKRKEEEKAKRKAEK